MGKKLYILIAAVLLSSVLSACNGGPVSSAAGVVADGGGDSSSGQSISPEVYVPGSLLEASYTNEFFNVAWQLPSGWYFASASTLAQLNSTGNTLTDNEAVRHAIETGSAYIDMMATDEDGVDNVTVAVRSASFFASLTSNEDDLISRAAQSEMQSLAERGYGNVELQDQATSFCGKRTSCSLISYEMGGVPVYERLVVLKRGNYILEVAATTAETDKTAELITQFRSYK